MESNKYIGINTIFYLCENEQDAKNICENFMCNLNMDEWLKLYDNKPIIYAGAGFEETALTNEEIAIILEKKIKEFMEEIKNGI
jgi:hypothetical protein